nr:egg cell-secreted protein 1.2-like [Quercus suber]
MAMNNVFIFMVVACLLANETGTRDLPIKPGYKSVSSFQVSGDQAKLTDLGPGCCGSISTITKICLPSTLASFGFTSELHNKLQEHCHAMSGLATAPIAGSEAPLANY